MAVLLVATFPILLLINSPVALLCLSVGMLLLYRDNRDVPLAASAPVPTRRARTGHNRRPYWTRTQKTTA